MFQFLWRPRPTGLLSDEEVADVKRGLGRFIERYKLADKEREERRVLLDKLRKRQALESFRDLVRRRNAEWAAKRSASSLPGALLGLGLGGSGGGADADAEEEFTVEETYEKVLEEIVETVE